LQCDLSKKIDAYAIKDGGRGYKLQQGKKPAAKTKRCSSKLIRKKMVHPFHLTQNIAFLRCLDIIEVTLNLFISINFWSATRQ
jgi:hypothetical protein